MITSWHAVVSARDTLERGEGGKKKPRVRNGAIPIVDGGTPYGGDESAEHTRQPKNEWTAEERKERKIRVEKDRRDGESAGSHTFYWPRGTGRCSV